MREFGAVALKDLHLQHRLYPASGIGRVEAGFATLDLSDRRLLTGLAAALAAHEVVPSVVPHPAMTEVEHLVTLVGRAVHFDAAAIAELRVRVRSESSWFSRLAMLTAAAIGACRLGQAGAAALDLASAAPAWRGYRRWLKSIGEPPTHELLRTYEDACTRALAALEPPRKPGACAVETIVRVARDLRPARRAKTDRTIAALDALVTIGGSTVERRFAQRVVREIAAMLGGRVLFHRRGRAWLRLRPQAEHTLSGWTVLKLATMRQIRSFRVRPCPEFWRPDQRRPRALLVFPIGGGVACIARDRRFRRRERDAVRAVLRFLAARIAAVATEAAATPSSPPTPLPAVPSTPHAEGVRDGLVGRSPAWREVLRQVGRVAETTATVLLVGETGTGKELVARAIHAASGRSTREFVAINCGALSPTLLESELFGHVRGAFTGADRTKEGLFVRAHRGTLFLDEVADMPPDMQVALLRVLEEREVRPVGGTRPVRVDVRLVAASGRDLVDEVELGRFRRDLYHRLDVVRIDLPALRDRRDDLPLLALHVVGRLPEHPTLHPDAMSVLLDHDWPGNVRELENVLRASSVLTDGAEITPEVLRGVMAQHRRIREAAAGLDPAPRGTTLVHALGTECLSASELAARLGVSVRTVNRALVDLVARGAVQALGEARARRYTALAP
jgi:DNA-binding NtrC family response regulator